MSTTYAVYASDGPLATLTFNRPEARNAMTWEMYQALVDACDRADDDPAVRVLILKGAGGKAFVAGTDIAQFQSFRGPEDGIAYEKRIDQVLDRLERVTKATIAQIQGVAAGGGCAIAFELRSARGDARVFVRYSGRAYARELPLGRDLQPAGGPARSGSRQGHAADRTLRPGGGSARDSGSSVASNRPRRSTTFVQRVRASDRRQRAADGSSDEGDDPSHHGGTPPAAR